MAKDELIAIVPYDPSWPAQFEREAAAITEVIGRWVSGGVHHVGSTAVPGLAAKPVIDIMAGVDDLEQTRGCIELLSGLSYCYAPYLAQTMHWFCKPSPSRRTHHLHLVPKRSKRFADVLAFRDYLRGNPSAAAEYEALKRRLAAEHTGDRDAYTEAKGELVARFAGLAK
jgi:GrpB-like predicted nucleotidyltransferase (UPF0157 family)